MAFEEIWAPLVVMLMMAIFLFPAIYVLDIIRRRVDPGSKGREFMLLFSMSFLLSMTIYPLAIPEDMLPFNSMYVCYGLALIFIFLVYLIVFNKTKE